MPWKGVTVSERRLLSGEGCRLSGNSVREQGSRRLRRCDAHPQGPLGRTQCPFRALSEA